MFTKQLPRFLMILCLYLIAIGGIVGGIKDHETWRIVLSAATFVLLVIATTVQAVKAFKTKKV